MWSTLEEQDPDLVVLCPPCGALIPTQNINFPSMSKIMMMNLVVDELHYMRVSM